MNRHSKPMTSLWLLALAMLLAPWRAWAGAVLVSNETVVPLTLTDAAGATLGEVAPGASLTLQLPEGAHDLKALRPNGDTYASAHLAVAEAGGPRWQILPTEGSLEVRNLSTEDMTIFVDGQALLDVPANGVGKVEGLRPGPRALRAVSQGEVRAVTAAEIEANTTFTWRLAQTGVEQVGARLLRISNFSGGRVDVFVDGKKRIGIFPGDSAALVGLPARELSLEARGPKGELVASQKVDLSTGSSHRWVVAGPDGGRAVVEILNQRAEALKVCVDGAYCLRVAAGATIEYDDLTPGHHTLQAYVLKGESLLRAVDLELTIGKPYRWVIDAK